MRERFVHLTPRLSAALDMLLGYDTVADVGCDHGRLTAALLQQNVSTHIIASDISEDSLHKAEQLIGYIGLRDRASFRVGDGLSVLNPGEADAIAMLGIGGTLMARILDAAPKNVTQNTALVLQPMRAQEDIRSYLYLHRYHIIDDRLISEGKRIYQVFRAVPKDTIQALPAGWPEDYFDLGYVSFIHGDPLFSEALKRQKDATARRLCQAAGTGGEDKLLKKQAALACIEELLQERIQKNAVE